MALIILEDCSLCDACVMDCPNEAISEGDPLYIIDSDLCTECVGAEDEPQCQLACPEDCIEKDPKHEETHAQLLEKYYAMQ
ncbi:MAG: YfhL family 4Fe-4S dicluster ferredoxin [Gammaproteobacteria bacterium]|nr:YfhL family 4Fe-4S dicluster ferredoxin [Gammaproteobacteria bacterium]